MPQATVRLVNATRNTVLGDKIVIAQTSLSRMVGLLPKASLEPGAGLIIAPSQGVHTVGMRFAIDVIFLDRKWRVIDMYEALPPFRISRIRWKARAVVELPAGTITQTATSMGDELQVHE